MPDQPAHRPDVHRAERAADGHRRAASTILPDPAFGQIYRVTRANFNTERVTTQNYRRFFVQDTWKVGNRLTINPGVRYEQETLVGDRSSRTSR